MAVFIRGRKAEPWTRQPKYHNRRVEADGIKFDSLKEMRRYGQLKQIEKFGEIKGLQVHPVFQILINGHLVCKYVADFEYLRPARKTIPAGETACFVWDEKGNMYERIVEDCKGMDRRSGWDTRTPVYILKKKLMRICLGIEITEV